jgi:sporulation protein YlmC with PRC-barrel domain
MFVKDLYRKEVISSDNKTVGMVANLILNILTQEIEILVFPKLIKKLVRNHIGAIVGSVTGQAIAQVKKFFPEDTIITEIIDATNFFVSKEVTNDVKKRVMLVEEAYYMIPLSSVSSFGDTLHLSLTLEECRAWHLNVSIPAEYYIAFFPKQTENEKERKVAVTLDLPNMYGIPVQDLSSNQGKIIDLLVNDSGIIEYVLVDLRGEIKTIPSNLIILQGAIFIINGEIKNF